MELNDHQASILQVVFDPCLRTCQSLYVPAPVIPREGIKLRKNDVPIFSGNMMNWRCFWEQYDILIHSRAHLTDMQKLAYLCHLPQHSPAKHIVKGLLRMGSEYPEVLECLKKHYGRPRVLHHTHVKAVVQAPSVKDGWLQPVTAGIECHEVLAIRGHSSLLK